jgi:hypothetical protein
VVQVIDYFFDSGLYIFRFCPGAAGNIFQSQPNRVHGLDDTIVKVPADAVAFVGHRQALGMVLLLQVEVDVFHPYR